MVSLNDVLLAMSNIPVSDPIAEIWGRQMQGGYKIIEYTGALPITINANGDPLLDYRIYGASGGVGEPTENLIDASLSQQTIEIKPSTQYNVSRYFDSPGHSASDLIFGVYDENDNLLWSDYLGTWWSENIKVYDNAKYFKITIPNRFLNAVSLVEGGERPANYIPYGYKLPLVIHDQNLLADNISQFGNGFITTNGGVSPQGTTKKEKYSDYISIAPNTSYTFAMTNGFPGNPSGSIDTRPWRAIAFYSQNKKFISRMPVSSDDALKPIPFTVTSPSDAFFARVTWRSYGSEECPVLVTNRDIYPVYIGDTPLGEYEYVSYSDQKIYKMVTGALTPTDPPVPLPAIPTVDGTTIIDYDGTPKPSQMYIKYNGKG
jgi:hypothetical protein